MPVNMDAVKPTAEESSKMAVSEWFFQQALFKGKLCLFIGKVDAGRAADLNEFANDERTQFMNLALRNNPMLGAFSPYTTLGCGFIVKPTDWLTITTAFVNADGKATTFGFETAFQRGGENFSIAHEYTFNIKPFGQPGHQRVGLGYSPKDFQDVAPVCALRPDHPAPAVHGGTKEPEQDRPVPAL